MNSYFYNIAEKGNLKIEEFLLKNEDLKVYLEKLIETDKYGKSDFGMRNRIRDAIKDSSFEKVIENSKDTLKARIFFDMPINIDWFFGIYEDRCFYHSEWNNNEQFTIFSNSLPISIDDWGKYAKEVFEDPEILRLFVEMDETKEKISELTDFEMLKKLQNYIDREDDIDKISTEIGKYIEKIKQISEHGK